MDKAQLLYRIKQIGDRATKGISDVMRDEAENIRDLARSNAPVDEGNLEAAIKTDFDYQGINRRLRASIYIDMEMPEAQGNGRTVGRYAEIMHELLAPYGSGRFNLGKKSEDKRAAGHDVGGKFLERAAEARVEPMLTRVMNIVRRSLR